MNSPKKDMRKCCIVHKKVMTCSPIKKNFFNNVIYEIFQFLEQIFSWIQMLLPSGNLTFKILSDKRSVEWLFLSSVWWKRTRKHLWVIWKKSNLFNCTRLTDSGDLSIALLEKHFLVVSTEQTFFPIHWIQGEVVQCKGNITNRCNFRLTNL